MKESVEKIMGYPLLGLGVLSLASGVILNYYWAMLLGLLGMAVGSLKLTDRWG